MVSYGKKIPVCINTKCPRVGKEFYIYTDGESVIGLCFACGGFDGISTSPEALEELLYSPEMLLDLIHEKVLVPVN